MKKTQTLKFLTINAIINSLKVCTVTKNYCYNYSQQCNYILKSENTENLPIFESLY